MKKTLDVYLDHVLVGYLMQDEVGHMRFVYDQAWVHRPNAMPISWSLPLKQSVFSQKECRGFFSGILPEAAHRAIIARILGISAHNDYAMLEQIGGECAGAVTFLPTGTALPEKFYDYKPVDNRELAELLTELPKRPLLVGEPGLRLSLAGAQNKIAVYVNDVGEIFLPLGGAPSTHILKPAIARFSNIVSNEALCLALAESVGIPTVRAEIGFAENVEYILVKRYDRLKHDEAQYPIRLHQEDFCQALGILPEHKYQNEGGPSLKDCCELLRNASSQPAKDIQRLIDVTIFNIIIGNNDAHGKNFSLLFRESHNTLITQLAPAYDILSTVYYPELSHKMAMKIGKAYVSEKLVLKDIEAFAADVGLGRGAVLKRFAELAEQTIIHLPLLAKYYPKIQGLMTLIDERAAKVKKLVS